MIPPTDLELMMFYDGELEEPRRGEVAAFLSSGAPTDAGAKLAGLSLSSELFRESQQRRALTHEKHADGIASSVMRQIASSPQDTSGKASPNAEAALGASAANDNGRFILGLAAVAAAAAAAMFFWGRTPPNEAATASAGVQIVEPPAQVAVQSAKPPAVAPLAVEDVREDEAAPSVEIASVDFSARSGAVYYVAGEDKGQTTAVVWLKDE